MASLTLRKIDKGGMALYSLENVRGSVYFSKSLFATTPPSTIEVNGIEFAAPGTPGAPKVADPERVRKAQEAAAKAQARAVKAQEKANKLAARLQHTASPIGAVVEV
jgi:hypothetical protein